MAGRHSCFVGDRSRWRGDVPSFTRVRYRSPWTGVDLVCYEKDGHLEYDLVVAPGADLAQVEFAVQVAHRACAPTTPAAW